MVAVFLHRLFFHLAAGKCDASADIKGRAGTPVATRDLSPPSTQRLPPGLGRPGACAERAERERWWARLDDLDG